MANLTLSIDDELLRAARVRAVTEGTSVNEICRRAIEIYAAASSGDEKLQRFDQFIASMQASAREAQSIAATWRNRDELYDDMIREKSGRPAGR